MRKVVLGAGLLLVLTGLFAFTVPSNENTDPPASEEAINWLSWEEAMIAMEESPKKIFIDVYTDWCGWCKRMDKNTFSYPEIASYINENFHAVKFNAEQREPITFKGKKYEFIPGGRRGIHGLAYTLLNKNASYPSFVVLDSNLNRQNIIKGYKAPAPFLNLLGKKDL